MISVIGCERLIHGLGKRGEMEILAGSWWNPVHDKGTVLAAYIRPASVSRSDSVFRSI